MGLSAECAFKICFIGDNYKDRTRDAVKKILNITNNDFFPSSIDKLGYGFKYETLSKVPPFKYAYFGIVSMVIENDRNFWFERFGLNDLKNIISSCKTSTSNSERSDWYAGYGDFAKSIGCMLDIDTFCIDNLHKERFVVGINGTVLLKEENECELENDPSGEFIEKWSNTDYGRKSFDEIIIEHYDESSIFYDVNYVNK